MWGGGAEILTLTPPRLARRLTGGDLYDVESCLPGVLFAHRQADLGREPDLAPAAFKIVIRAADLGCARPGQFPGLGSIKNLIHAPSFLFTHSCSGAASWLQFPV